MRLVSYFKPPDGTEGGYLWATSTNSGSAGRRVRCRFRTGGHCRTPLLSALDEIMSFTNKRSLPIPQAIDESDFSTFSIKKVFPLGSLFKIELGKPPDHSDRSWHGTNLYCAHPVAKHGLRGRTPQHGPFGVYSFNDSRVWKMQFYCVYTLSGTGRAWTAIVELAIPDGKYQTVSKVQWCSQAEDTTIVAVWLHGLEYSEFRSEFIWPTWNPELEIQPRP